MLWAFSALLILAHYCSHPARTLWQQPARDASAHSHQSRLRPLKITAGEITVLQCWTPLCRNPQQQHISDDGHIAKHSAEEHRLAPGRKVLHSRNLIALYNGVNNIYLIYTDFSVNYYSLPFLSAFI